MTTTGTKMGTTKVIETRNALEQAVKSTGSALKAFPRGAAGLTPDSVKATDEYKSARAAYDRAFTRLQSFNAANAAILTAARKARASEGR